MGKKKDWYSAKGLFLHRTGGVPPKQKRYEESIIILRASSEVEAEGKARKLFRKRQMEGVSFLNELEICPLFDDPKIGAEVYWLLRLSPLSVKRYVATHWDDGKPRSCRSRGWDHHWYNAGKKRSGCYNCYERRKGELWKK